MTEMTRAGKLAFADAVRIERARLALVDPLGEVEAVAPLSPVRARQILLDFHERRAELMPMGTKPRDDRDLLDRLGVDPTRSSGRIPCPAHGGRDRNLAWRLTPEGRALLTCHSHHCSFDEIVRSVS
jgi:hypothetical protein